ncbi:MAG: hypothetical protein WAT74_12145, partial [Flavobacteriales bacterium]
MILRVDACTEVSAGWWTVSLGSITCPGSSGMISAFAFWRSTPLQDGPKIDRRYHAMVSPQKEEAPDAIEGFRMDALLV